MRPATLLGAAPARFAAFAAAALVAQARHRERFRDSSGVGERKGHPPARPMGRPGEQGRSGE